MKNKEDDHKSSDDEEDDDDEEEEEEREVSLSEYIHQELTGLWNDPTRVERLAPFVRHLDAYIQLDQESSCQLPPLDWKIFRKSYSILMWVRPVIMSSSQFKQQQKKKDLQQQQQLQQQQLQQQQQKQQKQQKNDTSITLARKLLLRMSTSESDNNGTGVCVQCPQDWKYHKEDNTIQTVATAYALPPNNKSSSQMLLIPLKLFHNEWNLIGITHTFPYLKRPQLTICVNGTTQGTGELSYPVVEGSSSASTIMPHNTILHNMSLGGVAVPTSSSSSSSKKSTTNDGSKKPDYTKSASELMNEMHQKAVFKPWVLQLASCAVHADLVTPDMQALLYTTGPALSLQQLGKVVTPLPPVDNWTKGSSWEGPNVGIPLAVHAHWALPLQHLSGKVVHAFGATHARVLRGRLVLPQPYVPGETDSTPKVGLVQPAVPLRNEELPALHVFGDSVHVVHALSEYLLQCDNGTVDTQLFSTAKHLSIVLLEQGLLPSLVMPFFLAQMPSGAGMLELQQPLFRRSLEFLHKLYSNEGKWASDLIGLLCDAIYCGGGRTQELVLQGGLIHVLASSLRRSLLRAYQYQLHNRSSEDDSAEKFLADSQDLRRKELSGWWVPSHEEACPKWIPLSVAKSCARLVAACCGVRIEVMEFTPATKLQRSSDLALTAVFGMALNFDLWGRQHTDVVVSQVAWRYGNVQGGQVLRKQVPIQSILDSFRVRLQDSAANNNSMPSYLAQIVQHMLLASLTHPKNIVMAEHDVSAALCALADCPLGSVGAHVILSSLTNILEWCHSATSTDEQVLANIASRLGRNLLMGQYHDVLAPMLLSRTVFCGQNTTSNGMNNHPGPMVTIAGIQDKPTSSTSSSRTSWQSHWRMALTLFAWVTSISGPEGSIAAQSTGGLLLASGLAGSLNGVLVDEKATQATNSRFISNLFLPPPTMALMVRQQKEYATSWNYTDVLNDRLQVMVPLLPGLVVSLVWDVNKARLEALQEMMSAVGGAFHRVFGVLMQNISSSNNNNGPVKRLGLSRQHKAQTSAIMKASKDFVPHLIMVVVWLEHAVQSRLRTTDPHEAPTVVLKAVPPKTPEERQRSDSQGSWVEVSSNAFSDADTIALDAMVKHQELHFKTESDKEEEEAVACLRQAQKAILTTLTDLLTNAMKLGGGESSTLIWRTVLMALEEAVINCDAKNKAVKNMAHDVLCRLVAIVLTKVQVREYEWEMWSAELCSAVARLCDLVEEKELLMKPRGAGNTHSRDQIVLLFAMLQVMQYGREMTGWCQLILPNPPDLPADMLANQQDVPPGGMATLTIEEHIHDIKDKADHLYHQVAHTAVAAANVAATAVGPTASPQKGPTGVIPAAGTAPPRPAPHVAARETINTDTLDGGRHHFVPPEAPGASSKLLLPVLQPSLRIVLSCFGSIPADILIAIPSHQVKMPYPDEEGTSRGEQAAPVSITTVSAPTKFLEAAAEEIKSTMVAAIVGLSFPNARDVSLNGLAWLRRILEPNHDDDDEGIKVVGTLFAAILEEIRVRYEGERRRREQALFDAYDDLDEASASAAVERLILGGDLIPNSSRARKSIVFPLRQSLRKSMEEITFEVASELDNDDSTGEDDGTVPLVSPPQRKLSKNKSRRGSEDFVMFHETYTDRRGSNLEMLLQESGGSAKLGWEYYKGLGSTLESCGNKIHDGDAEGSSNMTRELLKLMSPYLDAWDANTAQEAADSELVELFENVGVKDSHDEDEGGDGDVHHSVVKASQTAADSMSTFIEMASVEKSRLSELVNSHLPSHRHSLQAYTERYCWTKYFEAVGDQDECSMDKLWERGIGDGNRDIRSRLISMPCNPQFKRHIPKYLDHGADEDEELSESAHQEVNEEEGEHAHEGERSGSVVARGLDIIDSVKSAVAAGKLEIVDITKKEIAEEEMPALLTPNPESDDLSDGDDDDIYGDGSLGFPTREEESNTDEASAKGSTSADTATTDEESADGTNAGGSSSQRADQATTKYDKEEGGGHHHISSSPFAHPPDNSSSVLSLMHASIPSMIEKHFDNCLHAKAEGSRKCTMLISSTHLILEYDAESQGLYEGELMAVREEVERQRLIEEAGGGPPSTDADEADNRVQQDLERRQREIASLRPKSIRWNMSELSHVYLRRYRLRDSALEMFFIPSGGTSYGGFGLFSPATSLFIDFGPGHDGNQRRDEAANAIMRRSPPQTIKQWPDKSGQFLHEQLSRLTTGWVEGRITNFDYLLHLNMLAGRSYNDLCQYPVMPWVLSDYTSKEIPDLSDRSRFRDLSKPMGAINEDRLSDFLERFETFADPTIPPFMYGSHYSTSAGVVLHFLVRLHPFAGLHRQLQGGHFDVADRLFSSVPRTWDMCTGYSAAEVKELTPEWYCSPSFLKNTNKYKLGTSQDGELLGDVILPPWAEGSPERFIEIMRNALESDVCSDMLPDWIDLIFGRKQQGPEAIKAHNVFFYLTYYGSVDVASIEDEALRQATELQIAHFGQCPMQLFVRPHVRRLKKTINFRKLTFYQMLSAYVQGADHHSGPDGFRRELSLRLDGSQRVFGEPAFLPFFSAPISHWIHLDAPPPGPHAHLISVRLAGIDRCLAVDGNGIFHSFRWAWKPEPPKDDEVEEDHGVIDKGNFVAQRELPRFRTVPRLIHAPSKRDDSVPAVAISKTLFASRSVLLVLSDGDGRGGLAMQLVDPAKGSIKGEAMVPGVHSARVCCIVMDPIGTAAGHGGVGGELAIVGSEDGSTSLWRFMSSHYLPLRPRIRMRGHGGRKVQAVALSSAIHVCASVSAERCCIFNIGNGAMIRSFSPPQDTLALPADSKTKSKTVFCDTPAMCLSVQGYIVTVCQTTIFTDDGVPMRDVVTLHLFSLEGTSLGSKALESWRGIPNKITCTPDGTAITVCSGRGVTIHRLSVITPLEFVDEWHITETDELNENVPRAYDVDFGPSLMRPIVAAAACSNGVLRLHALPGITPWSERHKKSNITIGSAFSKPVGRIRHAVGKGLGFGKSFVGMGKEIGKEVSSDVKERGVGGFLAGTLFRKKG